MNPNDAAVLCLVVLLVLAAAAILVAILVSRRQSEREKYLRAAKNLVQEEQLNYALHNSGAAAEPPRSRRLMLYLCANTDPVQRFVFDPCRPVTIGRDPQCSIFVQDPMLSQHHCRIQMQRGQVLLVDERSANGTFVQRGLFHRYRVLPDRPLVLCRGDKICVGTFCLKVKPILFDDALM